MLLVNISPGSFLWDIQIVSAQIFKDKVPSALYDVLQSMTEATLCKWTGVLGTTVAERSGCREATQQQQRN